MTIIRRLSSVACAFALCFSVVAQAGEDWTAVSLQDLKREAKKGVKPAQLELGKRFEEGRQVGRDLKAAFKWYTEAGRDVRTREYTYSPPVGNEKSGRVIAFGNTRLIPGLPEAKARSTFVQQYLEKNRP